MRKIYEMTSKQNNVSIILSGKGGNRVRYNFTGGSVIANVLPCFQTENQYEQSLLEGSEYFRRGLVKLRQVVDNAPKQAATTTGGDEVLVSGVSNARQAMEWVANELGEKTTSGRQAVEAARKRGFVFEDYKG